MLVLLAAFSAAVGTAAEADEPDLVDVRSVDPTIVVELRYAGYVERETALVEQMTRLDRVPVPAGFDFGSVRQITHEARERLAKVRPATLGQASRLAGVSPADVQALMVLFRKPAAARPAAPHA